MTPLDKFPEVVGRLKAILQRFADALSCIDQCFIADDMLEQLPLSAQVGKTLVGGVDLNKARMRHVVEAVSPLRRPRTALPSRRSPPRCASSANSTLSSTARATLPM